MPIYEYDFGDGWRHVVSFTTHPRENGVIYPRCIGGSRAGRPDDSGGPYRYADFVEAWNNPRHDRHKEVRRWVGRGFDPEPGGSHMADSRHFPSWSGLTPDYLLRFYALLKRQGFSNGAQLA